MAATSTQALARLRAQEYVAVLIDQAFLETEPVESDMVLAHIGMAVPVHVNFAINGMDRVARELRAALTRHKRAVLVVRQEARQAVRNELKDTITALLLSCEMALQVPNLQSGVETRMQTVYELAQEIRAKLERPDGGSVHDMPATVNTEKHPCKCNILRSPGAKNLTNQALPELQCRSSNVRGCAPCLRTFTLSQGKLVHVLVTADTLSGTWTYTRELVSGLVSRGLRVTLVSFGEIPLPQQTLWMENLHGLEYRPTAFRLDWMQEGQEDFKDSSAYLTALVKEVKPDVLHLNQLCYGALPVSAPRVVVAHGDLITWWRAVHGRDPKPDRWLQWYREVVTRGLSKASVVVAPSAWMRDSVRECYTRAEHETVIYNGRNPIFFNPYVGKDDSVLAVGRLWDAGKQISLLTQHTHPLPVCIVGSETPLHGATRIPISADVKLSIDQVNVALKGPQTEAQLRTLYSRAAIYAATSRYEPFDMTTVEAAFSRCAIVANDIPPFREIWGDAVLYFRENDAASLASAIRRLSDHRDLCRTYGNRAYQRARECFTSKRMIDQYLELYGNLLQTKWAAA